MKINPVFLTALCLLILLGSAGLWLLASSTQSQIGAKQEDSVAVDTKIEQNLLEAPRRPQAENSTSRLDDKVLVTSGIKENIESLIINRQFTAAAQAIETAYSRLSAQEINELKNFGIEAAYELNKDDHSGRLRALNALDVVFDDLRIWRGVAQSGSQLEEWNTVVNAQLSLLEQQSDSIDIEQTLRELVLSTNQLRAQLASQDDELSINSLYQRILQIAPHASRFQLELAFSHLRLRETNLARNLLEPLVFDPEVGGAAQTALSSINDQTAVAQTPRIETKAPSRGIVVPLQASGTSFLVDAQIERRQTRLLLDTGASITALSRDLVSQLNLQPLNRQIRLNTANGSTTANLYRVRRLRLGNLELRDLVIADIDLGGASRFQGLLGTDALNQLRQDYDYVIDNRQKALIFRRR